MLIKISISKFRKGGLIFMLINEFTCLIPQAPLKTWTFMLSLFFITSSLVRYYYAYVLLTILDIGKSCKMVKVLDSMTRSVCIIYNVSSLCILHDANLVLRGSHHSDNLMKNALYMSKIDYSLAEFDIFSSYPKQPWQHPASNWMCYSTLSCYNLALLKYQIIQTE